MPLLPYQDRLPDAKANPRDLRTKTDPEIQESVCLRTVLKARYSDQLGETTAWGYDGQVPGRTFIIDNTQTVHIRWHNEIDSPLPFIVAGFPDPNLPDPSAGTVSMADVGAAIPQNQPGSAGGVVDGNAGKLTASTVTHQHGGLTASDSDGWTENVTPLGRFQSTTYGKNGLPDGKEQRSCLLWYHDHAIGVTRLNVYAGLFGFWVIRDATERDLIQRGLIPGEDDELILLVQDRNFETDSGGNFTGELLHKTETSTAEMFAPYTLVNGKLWPTTTVPAKPMRVRILNGSNARTYCFRIVQVNSTDTAGQPVYGADVTDTMDLWWQIGTDGGLLDYPVIPGSRGPDLTLGGDHTVNRGLVMAPAERVDLVIDFSKLTGKVAFVNTAFAAFHGSTATYPNRFDPSGQVVGEADPRVDYTDPKNKKVTLPPFAVGLPVEGFRLQYAHVLQFEVDSGTVGKPSPLSGRPELDNKFVRYVHSAGASKMPGGPDRCEKLLPADHNHRWIALTEKPTGNLLFRELQEYTTDPDVAAAYQGGQLISIRALNGLVTWYQTVAKSFHDSATFYIPLGGCEVWNFVNLTGDTHPVHVHLVQFQVLSRQFYNTSGQMTPDPTGTPGAPATPTAIPVQPDPNEQGFKDTVRVNPGEVVSVAAFFDGYCGKYMYHCHILEHEDHDMMRPFVVVAKDAFDLVASDMGGMPGMKM
jgi:FtsP/CotA-like multicopper oxidase with cupredoxin domain